VLGHTLGLASDGSHEDDPTTNFHPLVCLFGNEKLTTGVDVEDAVELLGLNICEVAERYDTGVGAANVELAEVCNNIIHELCGFLDVAHVRLECSSIRTVAQCLDLLDDRLSTLNSVGIVDGNLSASLGQLDGHRLANTTA
jgi:hypothetical protein